METQWTDEITFGEGTTIVPQSQDHERVDAMGAARAKADEHDARALGFSPRPPVYEIGTVVNSIGVANLKRSRKEWDAQPSLPELARTFRDQIGSEARFDSIVNAHQIHMRDNGSMQADGTYYKMTTRALDGLATHVTPGGSSYLRSCPPALRATNLNHWLNAAWQRDARASKTAGIDVMKPRPLTLRTRAYDGGHREVFAVTGPKYAAFDVDRVVAEAAAGIGGDARGTIVYDGYKMTMDAVFHSNLEPKHAVAGEFFKGCVRIQSADDGTGAVRVKLGLWRNLCRNLIIVDFDTVLVGSRRHVGSATIEADIAELMTSASERIALIVDKWSEASTEDVIDRYQLTDVDQVFRGLVINGCVSAPGVKPDEMVTRLHSAWEREHGYSKTAILNAITRAAHESSWSSWSDTEDLESQAGELLYQPVWNLDTSERTAEQVLA